MALQLSDVYTSARGSKTCRLRTLDGAGVVYTTAAEEGLTAPFGPSCFDKSAAVARVNLDVRLDDEGALSYFDGLDKWAVEYLAANSVRLFKRSLTEEQAKVNYPPCVRRKEGYAPLLHAKIALEGAGDAAHFWDASGVERKPPEDWRNAKLQLRVHVSHVWLMNSGYGFVINITDVRVLSKAREVAWSCLF